jgi:hypothetical protein
MALRYAAVTAALAVLAVLGGAPAATAAGSGAAPGTVRFAPYVELGAGTPALRNQAMRHEHLRAFTAAFVLGHRCTPVWDDGAGAPVATSPDLNAVISSAQQRGVKVTVSFGGASGTELAASCRGVRRLTAAYRSVVRRFSLDSVDFDIEGAQLSDAASITRRFEAIRALEHGDRHLVVSLTVPSAVHGMRPVDDPGVLALLRQAKADRVRVDLVNLMTMDYGGRHEMGAAAVTAARDARRQLRTVWPHDGYANLGITPMIGVNDVAVEHFTQADALRVAAFARHHHLGRTAFWALGRDQACRQPRRSASNVCSGVRQRPLAFTRAFMG